MAKISDVNTEYKNRKNRLTHPTGKFDKAGRWFPSADEVAECCNEIRYPSRAYPYSLLVHCRTKKHIKMLASK